AALAAVLFSIDTYISGRADYYKTLADCEVRKFETLEFQNIEKEISAANEELARLVAFYEKQPLIAPIFKKISEIVPEEIYLNSLSLNPNKDKKDRFQVSMTGHSETREALLEFKKNLESDLIFQGIYFPPSDWVKPSDINFSASFEISHD
ncbi:PilN domain-containing protein, partial [Patescibacteria group bacterium]|nr:PilN domain-containing protein [Patescibacteria group bacterium]